MGETKLSALNAPVILELVEGFKTLELRCWRCPSARKRLESPSFRTLARPAAVMEFMAVLDEVCAAHPRVRFFWKDAAGRFLGGSPAFVQDSGLASIEQVIGLQDTDEVLPWSRQGAKYQADDARVMALGEPQLDILERQDESTTITRWLRTSKVPVRQSGRVVGTIGGFEVINGDEAKALRDRLLLGSAPGKPGDGGRKR